YILKIWQVFSGFLHVVNNHAVVFQYRSGPWHVHFIYRCIFGYNGDPAIGPIVAIPRSQPEVAEAAPEISVAKYDVLRTIRDTRRTGDLRNNPIGIVNGLVHLRPVVAHIP